MVYNYGYKHTFRILTLIAFQDNYRYANVPQCYVMLCYTDQLNAKETCYENLARK